MTSSALPTAVLDRRGVLRLTAASVLAAGAVAAAAPAAPAAAPGLGPILQDTGVLATADPSARTKSSLGVGTLVGFTGNRKNGFTGISHARGYGWVPDAHVGEAGTDAVASALTLLEVRATAGADGALKFRIPAGGTLGFTGNRRDSYVGVRHAYGYGWAPADQIGPVTSGQLPAAEPAPTGLGETLGPLEVRSTSDPAGAVRFSLPSGTMVRFLGSRRGSMVGVSHPRGYGWAPGELLGPTSRPAFPPTAYFQSHTADARTYGYHVIAEGIDASRPIGMAVYLEGDYMHESASAFHRPEGTRATSIAAEANRRNLILVIPQTPRPYRTGFGHIWWRPEERPGNNAWLTPLLQGLYADHPLLDDARHWFLGYSGGAEFAAYEFFARQPESVMRSGGAVLVGGGGMYTHTGATTFFSLPSARFRQSVSLHWYVGDEDSLGSTNPPTWSAFTATANGERVYREAGFTRTSRTVLQGLDHGEYDLAGLLGRSLQSVGLGRLR